MDIQITFSGKKKVAAHAGDHAILADQPILSGGGNEAPAPFTLFLASIGTCAGKYVKSFCDQREIPTDGITIWQKHTFNPTTHLNESIDLIINTPSIFPSKYKDALIKVANQCAVKKHLLNPPKIEVSTNTLK